MGNRLLKWRALDRRSSTRVLRMSKLQLNRGWRKTETSYYQSNRREQGRRGSPPGVDANGKSVDDGGCGKTVAWWKRRPGLE